MIDNGIGIPLHRTLIVKYWVHTILIDYHSNTIIEQTVDRQMTYLVYKHLNAKSSQQLTTIRWHGNTSPGDEVIRYEYCIIIIISKFQVLLQEEKVFTQSNFSIKWYYYIYKSQSKSLHIIAYFTTLIHFVCLQTAKTFLLGWNNKVQVTISHDILKRTFQLSNK